MYHEMKNTYLVMNTENLTRIVTMKDLENLNANRDQNTYLLRLCTITSEDIKYPKASDNEMDPTVLKICTVRSWKTPRDYDDAFPRNPDSKVLETNPSKNSTSHFKPRHTEYDRALQMMICIPSFFLSMLNNFNFTTHIMNTRQHYKNDKFWRFAFEDLDPE